MNLKDLAGNAEEHLRQLVRTIYIKEEHIVINVGDEYSIAISRCDTAEKLLYWISHLCSKNWITPELLRYFIEVACNESNIVLKDT